MKIRLFLPRESNKQCYMIVDSNSDTIHPTYVDENNFSNEIGQSSILYKT